MSQHADGGKIKKKKKNHGGGISATIVDLALPPTMVEPRVIEDLQHCCRYN
jgi:hypothetical protein